MHRGHRDLRDLIARKPAWLWLTTTLLLAGSQTPAWAATPDDLLRFANKGQCPSTLVRAGPPLSENAICNPNSSVTRACDASLNMGSRAWHACYKEVSDCRNRVFAENKKISAYNSFLYACANEIRKRGGRPVWMSGQQPVETPSHLVTPAVYQPAPPPAPDPAIPPQTQPLNPYNPDPMQWGARVPDPGADPGYGGVSVGVEPKAQNDPALGGVVAKVKKLTTP